MRKSFLLGVATLFVFAIVGAVSYQDAEIEVAEFVSPPPYTAPTA